MSTQSRRARAASHTGPSPSVYACSEAGPAVQRSMASRMAGDLIRGQNGRVGGGVWKVLVWVAVWLAASVLLAAFFYWLRPRIPTRRMVVVVRSGDRRRVVAVSGRRHPFGTPDRVV